MSGETVQVTVVEPPEVIATDQALQAVVPALAATTGRLAVDTERACGFRYSQRAYLLQFKTSATGILLVDPIGISPECFADLDLALLNKEWILHAASQDLPSLRLCGLNPQRLFDTELSARLLGRDKVGLGPLVADVLGVVLAKDHANSDWSERPLPADWLSYAAADVEYLIELAGALEEELVAAEKLDWARQEFDHVLTTPAAEPRQDPWRRTANIHMVHTRRGLAVVRQMCLIREDIAETTDLAPHRIVNDRAISALAARVPDDQIPASLLARMRTDWRHRVDPAYLDLFVNAVSTVKAMSLDDLPPTKAPRHDPPSSNVWLRKNPQAAKRWEVVRPAVVALAESHHLPVENLIAPQALRTLLWEPHGVDDASVDHQLAELSVRPWQRELTVPVIAEVLGTC
ncbi:MAG: ribonuclease D [Propionibacteriaceae bacterium]|nr:ribonuclease D [Propionibacteriaceae bacterium]